MTADGHTRCTACPPARGSSPPRCGSALGGGRLHVRVGSRHEDAPSAGLSHFIEHVVFKGGGRFPTARAISEAIESVGGSINAATDKEATA